MTINVYQFNLPYEYTPEELNMHRYLSAFGSEHWNYDWFKEFKKVAEVDATELDEVFMIMNRWTDADEAKVTRLERLHSLSVGDILEKNGSYFMVDGFGFCELMSMDMEVAA